MSQQTRAMRALIAAPGVQVVPECYSALTGRIVEELGFGATWIGGHALGGMHYAIPDHGLITSTEMMEHAARIVEAISIPLLVDADQGGETSLNVRRQVRGYESIGVAGIALEDTVNPKHLYANDSLVPISEMQTRIAAAADARRDDAFVIIARSDNLFNGGTVDEAIRRGIAFADAGADMYFCIFMEPSVIDEIADAVPIPLFDMALPDRGLDKTGDTKLKVSLFTGFAVSTAAYTFTELLKPIKERGTYADDIIEHALPRESHATLVRDQEYLEESKRWGNRIATQLG